eukprot:TRINITY_DN11174_c0_g1_i2.p1 TRINITY_DN11174_c0_g1~~TRINITY_DN11174_c0_g1_i2.p1  ORF type:complete len:343 (+),score=93.23 TRINITY_DN11174_c0_g1_i2:143-1171(+)
MSAKENVNAVTLIKFILHNETLSVEKRHEIAILFSAIQLACKVTNNALKRAGLEQLYGLAGTKNVHNEEVKTLDLISNDAFKNALIKSEQVAVMVSEEDEEPTVIEAKEAGNYVLCFDPLDGSSNIDANVSVGSIFGIWEKKSKAPLGQVTKEDYLQSGKDLVGAGYAIYGTAAILVLCFGDEVHGFTLDSQLGEFVLTHRNIRVPEKGAIYSINEGNSHYWDQPTKDFVEFCKSKTSTKNPYSARYVGSMVADVHRTLLYGGIFAYPADTKSPLGKLRYLYEVAPLSYIMEHAGGRSSTGRQRCLDYVPEKIHIRMPVYMGSAQCVTDLEDFYKRADGAAK